MGGEKRQKKQILNRKKHMAQSLLYIRVKVEKTEKKKHQNIVQFTQSVEIQWISQKHISNTRMWMINNTVWGKTNNIVYGNQPTDCCNKSSNMICEKNI